jgi:hypothetical protein
MVLPIRYFFIEPSGRIAVNSVRPEILRIFFFTAAFFPVELSIFRIDSEIHYGSGVAWPRNYATGAIVNDDKAISYIRET